MPSLASQLPQDPPATTNPCRSELARDPLAPRSLSQTAVMPSLASQLPQDPPTTTNPCRSELARDPLAPRSFRQTAVMSSLASQLPQDLPTTTNSCRSELAREPLAPRSLSQTAVMPSLASQLPQDYRQPPQTPVGASLLASFSRLPRSHGINIGSIKSSRASSLLQGQVSSGPFELEGRGHLKPV